MQYVAKSYSCDLGADLQTELVCCAVHDISPRYDDDESPQNVALGTAEDFSIFLDNTDVLNPSLDEASL